MTHPDQVASVRYIVDDVSACADFYETHLGFVRGRDAAPAFIEVTRGALRLLLSGPASSGGRVLADGSRPEPGGWNRIHLSAEDLDEEITRLRRAGLRFRSEVVEGPGGRQILLVDPAGNLIELFEPASRAATS